MWIFKNCWFCLTLLYMLNNKRRSDWLHKHNAKCINLHEWFFIICLKPSEKQCLYIFNNETYPFVDLYSVRLCTKSFMGFLKIFKKFLKIILKYSWFTMLYQFLQYNKVFSCTFFFIFCSIMVYHRILNKVPCTIWQDLFIYSIRNSYIYGFITITTASWNS